MRAAKFLVTNASGTLVETLALLALSAVFRSFWGQYLVAPAIAFQLAVLSNFTVSYFWVWRERVPNRRWEDYFVRLARYDAAALAVFSGRLALVVLLGRVLRLDVVVCNLLILSFSGLASFGAQDRLVFRDSR